MMALSTFALLGSAMFDPLWFAQRMQGLALVPEPLWWLMGTIVAFYFGGRFQAKSQDFKKSAAETAGPRAKGHGHNRTPAHTAP